MDPLAKNPTTMEVVAGALRDERGRWLMQKRPAHKHHGGLWEFPGGKVKVGEIGEDALVRELNEELTITVAATELREVAHASSDGDDHERAIVITLYTIARWQGDPVAEPGAELGWFAPGEIAALPLPPLDCRLAEQLFAQAG